MLTAAELREIEASAIELARNAGKLLLGYFDKPLHVTYKAQHNRSPVTDADKASDDYLRGEIARRFPEHALLSEESEDGADRAAEVTWVIDPLDGTTNFLNGLPTFGVLIGVLEQGRPVASATFLPTVTTTEGRVLHAHAGGGVADQHRLARRAPLSVRWMRSCRVRIGDRQRTPCGAWCCRRVGCRR